MKRPKVKIYFFLALLILISSCRIDNEDEVRLPIAKFASNNVYNDSSFIVVSINNKSIIISDDSTSDHIDNFSSIADYICEKLKKRKTSPYPITLKIDSSTSYGVFDNLIEELELIGFQAVYLKTSTAVFFTVFPKKNNFTQNEVVKLYGSRFLKKRNIIADCSEKLNKNVDSLNEEFPPPPPPPPPPDFLNSNLKTIDSTDRSDECIIGRAHNRFTLNKKVYNYNEFEKELYKRNLAFIMLQKDNIYNDLIILIDIIKTVEMKKFNDISVREFNKTFDELSAEQRKEIKNEFRYRYMILSIAEQNIINNN